MVRRLGIPNGWVGADDFDNPFHLNYFSPPCIGGVGFALSPHRLPPRNALCEFVAFET